MRPRRQITRCPRAASALVLTLPLVPPPPPALGLELVWPVGGQRFVPDAELPAFVQPTSSGRPDSGLFGCVRNNGRRFHEGLDLKPFQRDKSGEALDRVLAALPGRVAHVNTVAGRSNYGRFVVLEHTAETPAIYSLYAHLARVEKGIASGRDLPAGAVLGRMGRSSSSPIPRSRAHLHIEFGLRLSDDFQTWYRRAKPPGKNHFGNYNGWNLVGFDPLDFFAWAAEVKGSGGGKGPGATRPVGEFIGGLPDAYTLRVSTRKVPDFVRRYPALLAARPPAEGVAGWDVTYTWNGLPKRWTPLAHGSPEAALAGPAGTVGVLGVDRDLLGLNPCRTLVFKGGGDTPSLGAVARRELQILFGFK